MRHKFGTGIHIFTDDATGDKYITAPWNKTAIPKPWRCFLDSNGSECASYCDHCSSESICLYEYKKFSK